MKYPNPTGGNGFFALSGPLHRAPRSFLWAYRVHTCRGEALWDMLILSIERRLGPVLSVHPETLP